MSAQERRRRDVPSRTAPAPGARCSAVLEALREARRPLTAREVGRAIGTSKHEARRLLSILLEWREVAWTSDGWQITVPLPPSGHPSGR